MGYLPLAHSDFIFAVIADELGFLGVCRRHRRLRSARCFGIQVALAAPPIRSGWCSPVASSVWFGVQAVDQHRRRGIGLMPVTGLTLPFFSAGGTSLFVSMAATGLLLNVARSPCDEPISLACKRLVAMTGGGTAGRDRHRRRHLGHRRGARRPRPSRPDGIHYVGAERGDRELAAAHRASRTPIWTSSALQRAITLRNLAVIPKAIRGAACHHGPPPAAPLRPGVVVSVGGYASMPAVLAARLRIPVVVVSYDR